MIDSMLDGTPTLRLNEFMLGSLDKGVIPLELENSGAAPKPQEIVFEMDKHSEDVVAKSKKGFGEEMALQDLKVSFGTTQRYCSNRRWSTSATTAKTSSKRTRRLRTLGRRWSNSLRSTACSTDPE